MCHDEQCIVLAAVRELRGERLNRFGYVIRLVFLSLPVHKRRTAGHLLELFLVVMEYGRQIRILHTRNDVERDKSYTGVAVCFELCERLFGGRILLALVLRDAVNDDMGGECRDDLYARMSRPNSVHRCLDGLLPRVFERRTKARHNDGILVRVIHHLRVFILQNADLRSLHQCRRRCLDLRVQLIRRLSRSISKPKHRGACKRSDQHFLPTLHHNSSQQKYKKASPAITRKPSDSIQRIRESPLPIARGSVPKHTVTVRQAVLPARFIAPLRLPKRSWHLSVTLCRFAPLTAAGPRRLFRLPY